MIVLGAATGLACATIMLATACAADTLSGVILDYEALARQTDASEGPGWPDVSVAAAAQRAQAYAKLDGRLAKLPDAKLSAEEKLTRELLDWRLDILVAGAKFDEDRIAFDNGDGFFNAANYAAQSTVIASEADAKSWIERLRALPAYYDAQIANMRRGIASGFTQPRPTAESVLHILKIAADQPVETSPLLKPFASMPATIPAERRRTLLAQAQAAIRSTVKPAQKVLVTFFEAEYVPHARVALAASSLPGGRDYYAFAVRRSTTTGMTPDEVFALGETEIRRIRAAMDGAMRDAGFKGDFAAFLACLRSDPQFYAPDLATYIEKASALGKQLDYLLPRWFKTLPRLTWGIRVKPLEMEASSGGYNLGDPGKGIGGAVVVGSRSFRDPLFGLNAWIAHEGVPGHHLQIALGQERIDLPAFRRRDDITAFVEGWALYAERLAGEMGIYATPYERFGQLSFEMWRACRLVMDVGIHWKGWSAERASSCLKENTALPQHVMDSEMQRYIAWPAQALAYKVGEVKLLELRARAEGALGVGFDIREFHDLLLTSGPMPLSILERRVDAWIGTRRSMQVQ